MTDWRCIILTSVALPPPNHKLFPLTIGHKHPFLNPRQIAVPIIRRKKGGRNLPLSTWKGTGSFSNQKGSRSSLLVCGPTLTASALLNHRSRFGH
jgi:hypothetical protein